jgi:hypothetical protein
MIIIRAYRAIDEPETCAEFLLGHRRVLEEFNLENISTNTPKWISHENTYVVIAEYEGEIIGGVRMQIVDDSFPLPLEEAVAHFDCKIYNLVTEKNRDGGACELCGLWNSRKIPPNIGLTRIISAAAISLSNSLNVRNVFAICAGYTLGTAIKMGFVIQKSVGNNGEFVYPNSNFKARVLCMNGDTLGTSALDYKREIMTFRNNPNYETNIIVEGATMEIKYQLNLNKCN